MRDKHQVRSGTSTHADMQAWLAGGRGVAVQSTGAPPFCCIGTAGPHGSTHKRWEGTLINPKPRSVVRALARYTRCRWHAKAWARAPEPHKGQ